MKRLKVFLLSGCFVSMLGTSAYADYNPEGDTNINVTTGTGLQLPVDSGEITFQATEAVHEAVSNSTGINMDYSYIYVNIDGQNVAAIDPPKAGY